MSGLTYQLLIALRDLVLVAVVAGMIGVVLYYIDLTLKGRWDEYDDE